MDTDRGKHGGKQRGLVFAVAVTATENVSRGMRLVAAYPHLDDEVANLLLNKLADSFRLVVKIRFALGECERLRCDLGSRRHAVMRKLVIPLADSLPCSFLRHRKAGPGIVHGH